MQIVLMVVQLVLTARVQGRQRRNRPMTSSRLGYDQDRPIPARLNETSTKPQDMPFIGHGALLVYKGVADVCTTIAKITEAIPLQ